MTVLIDSRCVHTQGLVVGLDASEVSSGCAGAVRNLFVYVVGLWDRIIIQSEIIGVLK